MTRVGVVGGGPAGLAAAYRLTTAGVPTIVFEAGSTTGGLARSMELWGQPVDLGAHMFTLKDPRIRRLWSELVGSSYDAVPRRTRVLFERWALGYPYDPAEVLRKLGVVEAARCVASLGVAGFGRRDTETDLESWVVHRFGRRAFELLFAGYVEKLFGEPAHKIDGAFAQTLLGFQQHGSLTQVARRRTATPSLLVRPHGGIGVLMQRLAEYVGAHAGEVRCDAPVARLTKVGERIESVELKTGETWELDAVVSALPLTLTARFVDLAGHREPPRFRSVVIVYLLVAGSPFREQWVFLEPARFESSRITNFRSWSAQDDGEPLAVLSAEFWCDKTESLWSASDEDLQTRAGEELAEAGLLRPQSILDGHVVRLRDAFPVPAVGYGDALTATAKQLSRFENLATTGGLGAISNAGVHGSLIAGMDAADEVARMIAPTSVADARSG